jgi:lipopolysaccharide/colanic/teichoic acid biosynthesis glycosyltransferase
MIKLYLYLIDFLVPILFGGVYFFLATAQERFIDIYFYNFIFFSCTLILTSSIQNYYENYYSKHFSEKIKISFVTFFISILSQLILHLYYELPLDFSLVILWITIPLTILLARFAIKKYYKNLNNIKINIIGTYYQFNDHEILMLTNKGYILFFYNSFQDFEKNNRHTNGSEMINVINYNTNRLEELKDYEAILISSNCFPIDKFMELYLRKIFIDYRNIINHTDTYNKSDFILKRLVDYFAIIFFIPILFLFCILIFFTKTIKSIHDSMFFVQKRYGLNKKIFNVYKIRTMYENSKNQGNTIKNDSRIYSFALIIRKLRIDELPQIFNILFGDMHLVGPRAEWINLADQYSNNIINYNYRHVVRPGITGWAQIIHPYGVNEEDARQKLMYDMYYIKHWSIWFEIEICIKTFMVILDKRGF